MSFNGNLVINWATHELAKFACEHWHYSKCIPKSKLVKVGVWENGKFIGVVIFSYGANQNLSSPYGLKKTECVELTRVALARHKTPVSKILSIAVKFLRKKCQGIKLIVSYADIDQGHHGGIYQANGWAYAGIRNAGTKSAYIINGKKIHPKTIFDRYGTRAESDIRKIHPDLEMFRTKGKHIYLKPLDSEVAKLVQSMNKPYPKRIVSREIAVPVDQTGEEGESPITMLHSLDGLNE